MPVSGVRSEASDRGHPERSPTEPPSPDTQRAPASAGAEEAGARREEGFRSLLAAAGSVIWTADPQGHFIEPQPAWERYTGQSWPQSRGAGWLEALHPEDRDAVASAWQRGRECGRMVEIESRVRPRARETYSRCLFRAAPVTAPDGLVQEWVVTLTDIEAQRAAERRLRVAERLDAVGRLAGGVAHEANNQMTVILGAAEFLKQMLDGSRGRKEIDYIREAAQRTAAITHKLLAFSERQILRPRVLQLNDVVRAMEPRLRRVLGERRELILRLDPGLSPVNIDPDQLEHVLLQLTANAREAMDQGGVLTMETADVVADQSFIAAGASEGMAPGRYARLVVTDTGPGLDPESLCRIFEPFFTTKEVGKGPGLGLSAVYGIVKQSGGHVWADSEPGRGTSVTVCLPRSGESPSERRPSHASGEPATREVILVAEDDEIVRIILARPLREAGYVVLEARDGSEALRVAAEQGPRLSLVIADVMMPRLNGRELRSELEARRPGLPLLFVSGLTTLDSVSQDLIEKGHEFLQKPVEPQALLEKVRALLAAGKH